MAKLNFQQSLLQSSVSQYLSKIVLMCCFGAQGCSQSVLRGSVSFPQRTMVTYITWDDLSDASHLNGNVFFTFVTTSQQILSKHHRAHKGNRHRGAV